MGHLSGILFMYHMAFNISSTYENVGNVKVIYTHPLHFNSKCHKYLPTFSAICFKNWYFVFA